MGVIRGKMNYEGLTPNPFSYVFNAPDVVKSGGLEALKILGEPKEIINETKRRLFAA